MEDKDGWRKIRVDCGRSGWIADDGGRFSINFVCFQICISRKCRNMTSLDFINPCPNGTCYNNGVSIVLFVFLFYDI